MTPNYTHTCSLSKLVIVKAIMLSVALYNSVI